jgi:hypothetical protein
MRKAGIALIFTVLSFAAPAAGQDLLSATAASTELRQMCEGDRGELWGVSLCGPLLVVDPASRAAWASAPDGLRVFRSTGAGWMGTLPDGVPIANTTVEWAGQRWIMVVAPLPQSAEDRRVLVAHEAWHRAQRELGLTPRDAANAHLETERGRYWMRLELRALGAALRSNGRARLNAIRDAMMFRTSRLSEFPDASWQETELDRNEGLAAYTGVKLGATDNPYLYAARLIDSYERRSALARSYAYASGPAYGLLLDALRPNWRSSVASYSPADMLSAAANASYDAGDLRDAIARYSGQAIAAEERTRAETQRARIADLRARFANGPRLELALQNMRFEFDPNTVTPVEGLGNYYPALTLRDAWGELVASEGAVISADFTRVTAANPAADGLSGPGWQLRLEPGYQVFGPDQQGVVRVAPSPLIEPASAPPT